MKSKVRKPALSEVEVSKSQKVESYNPGSFGCFLQKKGNLIGSLFPNVLFSLILNGIDDGFEGLGIVHGQIGQHLAVDLDILGV